MGNVAFFSDRFLFDNDFLRFIWNIMNSPLLENSSALHHFIFQLGLGVGVEIVAHARAICLVPVWLKRIADITTSMEHAVFALKLLAKQKGLHWLLQGLVTCPNVQTRVAFSDLICSLVSTAQPESNQCESVEGVVGIITALMLIFDEKLKELQAYHLQEMYDLILALCKLGPYTRRTLLRQEAVFKIITCFVVRHTQANVEDKKTLLSVVKIMGMLVCSADVGIMGKQSPKSKTPHSSSELEGGSPRLELSRESLAVLLKASFLDTALTQYPLESSTILRHLCWDRPDDISKKLMTMVVEKLVDATSGATIPAFKPYMQVLSDLMHMQDSLVAFRLHDALHLLWPRAIRLAERQGSGDPEFLYEFSKVLLSLALTVPEASSYIYDNRDQWKDWAPLYFNERAERKARARPY